MTTWQENENEFNSSGKLERVLKLAFPDQDIEPDKSNVEHKHWKRFFIGPVMAPLNIRLDTHTNRIEVNAGALRHLYDENKLRVQKNDLTFFGEFTLDFGRDEKALSKAIVSKVGEYLDRWHDLSVRVDIAKANLEERKTNWFNLVADCKLKTHDKPQDFHDYSTNEAWDNDILGLSIDLERRAQGHADLTFNGLSYDKVRQLVDFARSLK